MIAYMYVHNILIQTFQILFNRYSNNMISLRFQFDKFKINNTQTNNYIIFVLEYC